MEAPRNLISRRAFIGSVAAASAFTIVPRHVLGGPGRIAPSDRLNIAQIGCGTQAIRQVIAGMIQREDLHISCVCDPMTDSTDYVDWSLNGNRNQVRRLLENPSWGENDGGIRAGRECAKEIVEAYYGKSRPSGQYTGCRTYSDFRELLEQENDIDAVIIITPDHLHATISLAAMKKGRAAISHKPISNVLYEVRRTVQAARDSGAVTHMLAYSNRPDYYHLDAWLKAGAIGTVREVHNWSARPFWPQGWQDYPTSGPPVPKGFDWTLWQGPEPDRVYHPDLTHALYRGWFAYGAGCLGDMGNYSLWQPHRMLGLGVPVSVEATRNTESYLVDRVSQGRHVSKAGYPRASTIRFRHSATSARPAVDVFWYDGGIRPATPLELYEDNESLPDEGMMFVGDDGKILCGFNGTTPKLLPARRMKAFEGSVEPAHIDTTDSNDEWINAVRNKGQSRGSFLEAAALAEVTCLGNIALRVPGRRLDWDTDRMAFTNADEANQYIRRDYRPGWEI